VNVHQRIDLQLIVKEELDQSVQETWNTAEIAGDVLDALTTRGYDIVKRAEQCGHLEAYEGRIYRCARAEHGDESHDMTATPFLEIEP
jgi:hypothetical protein